VGSKINSEKKELESNFFSKRKEKKPKESFKR
jgi:hypothetical protein